MLEFHFEGNRVFGSVEFNRVSIAIISKCQLLLNKLSSLHLRGFTLAHYPETHSRFRALGISPSGLLTSVSEPSRRFAIFGARPVTLQRGLRSVHLEESSPPCRRVLITSSLREYLKSSISPLIKISGLLEGIVWSGILGWNVLTAVVGIESKSTNFSLNKKPQNLKLKPIFLCMNRSKLKHVRNAENL